MDDLTDSSSDDWRIDSVSNPVSVSRRQAIGAVATVVGGGSAIAIAGAESARAQVSVDDVNVPDTEFEADAVDPVVDAEIAYAYRHDSTTELVFELLVGETVIAAESLRTASAELESDTQLSGRIAESDAWTTADFEAPAGETIQRDVTVGVRFAVLDGETVVVEDTAEDTATVTVANPSDSTASVGMVAQITDGS